MNRKITRNFLSRFKVVQTRKLGLRQKWIILLSRIAILLLKESFKREKIIFGKNHLKHRNVMYLTNFIFNCTFFHIVFCQIFKNRAILINRGSFFQGKNSLQIDRFQFLKIKFLMAETIKKQFFKTKFS